MTDTPTIGGLKRAGGLAATDSTPIIPTGSAQTDAAAITSSVAVVTGADGTKGVILPSPSTNIRQVLVYSATATNGLKVYPHSGGDINDGTQNAAITIEGKTAAYFVAVDGITWAAIFTANT